jgi:hypothetical protein
MGISGNRAVANAVSAVLGVDCGKSDVIVTMPIVDKTKIVGMCFRVITNNDYWYVEYSPTGATFILYRIVAGAASAYATSGTITVNTGDIFKVELNGTNIKFYTGATLVFNVNDTHNQTATIHGLRSTSGAGTVYFDDFKVEDITTGTTTQDGIVSIIGTGTLSSTGRILKNGSASLLGTGTLSSTATKIQNALASVVGTGTLTATPVTIKNGQTSIIGQGLFVANADTQTGVVIVDGNASLLGNGVLEAIATNIILADISLFGQGTFASNGIREAFGAVSFIGNGLLNVVLREITIVTGEAWLIGSGVFEAKAQGRTWEDAPYLAVPMYAVVQATEKNWKEVVQEKVKM